MIQKKYYKLVRVSYEDSAMLRMTNISDQVGTFSVTKTGSPNTTNMEYSTDGVTWTAYDFTNLPTVEVPAGGNIYLRGNNPNGTSHFTGNSYYTFNLNTNFVVGGNICSLIDKTDTSSVTSLPQQGGFEHLFYGNTTLLSASDMNFGNVTVLKGLSYMFNSCTSLTEAPDFSNITSIESNGCQLMFSNCTSLTTPPDLSSITTVKSGGCYSMFSGCTSLTTTPDLSSVTTVESTGCRYMFSGCTSLTTAPDLSSVTSVGSTGFGNMFAGCSSLTTAPDLSSVTSVGSGGCENMYQYCSKLSSATAPNIDTWDTSKFNDWFNGAGSSVSGTKTLYKPAALTIPTSSNSGVPTGWTVPNY